MHNLISVMEVNNGHIYIVEPNLLVKFKAIISIMALANRAIMKISTVIMTLLNQNVVLW